MRASSAAFAQYNSTSRRLDPNLRLRYNFAGASDLWIVYNGGLATKRVADPLEPRLPSPGRAPGSSD
jgi:hypothetical protein